MAAVNSFGGRCLAMTVGAAGLAAVLLASSVPAPVLLAIGPVLVCVGMHLVMSHGDADGEQLLDTARRAVQRQAERPAGPVDRIG